MSAIKTMCGELYPLLLENLDEYEQWPQHAVVIDDEFLGFNVFDYSEGSKMHSNRSKLLGATVLIRTEDNENDDSLEINYVPGNPMSGIMIDKQVFATEPFSIVTITDSVKEPVVLTNAEGQKVEHGMPITEQSAVLVALTTVVCEKIIDDTVQANRDHILASAV